MRQSRRLVPYVLLGILTLGTGLGAGLGVAAQSTQSSPAIQPEVKIIEVPACTTETASCIARSRKFHFPIIPKGLLRCVAKEVAGVEKPLAFAKEVDAAMSLCEKRTGERPQK